MQIKRTLPKVILLLLVSILFLSLTGCAKDDDTDQGNTITPMTAGAYTVEVTGMKPMTVTVTLSETKIEKIDIVTHEETPGVSDVAINDFPLDIIDKQSIGVDLVSGATITSSAIIEAVRKAIEEAGGVPSEFEIASGGSGTDIERPALGSATIPTSWDKTYDVVVVGGGFAGLAAAYEAASQGASTLLIDKMPVLGGNSQINGGVYASYTSSIADELYTKLNLTPDTAEKHIEDTIVGGDYMSDIKLVENFVYGSPYFLNLMLENGLKVRESITRPGGHYGYRTYTTENGVGSDIVQVQKKLLEESDAEVMLTTTMQEIYRETTGDQRVVGIKASAYDGTIINIKAEKAVILATGGFSGNVEMRSKQVPALTEDIPTTNHVGATGEGIVMAQEIGANTMQMSYIQLYPFADPNTGRLDATAVIPFSGPSSGIVYVDVNGNRYVNEGERRDVNARAAQESGGFPTFSIFGQDIVDNGGFITDTQLQEGMEADRIFKADTIAELVDMINAHTYKGGTVSMTAEQLQATITQHNGYIDAGVDPDFGKVIDQGVMLKIESGPYYAIPQWPSVHHTMGGLTITENTEVQDIWGDVIPGLFAAGEAAGGIHGTNRLGSNAIPDAAVHGIIAAHYAVTGKVPSFLPRSSE